MQRFLPVGQARLQAVGAVEHDPVGAQQAVAALEAMRPEAVVVDRSVQEWTGPPDAFQELVLTTVPGLRANALWDAVDRSVRGMGLQVTLLHGQTPPPPDAGLRQLRRLLSDEGFDASGEPRRDLAVLHQHYVTRCGPLWQWLEARRDASAARLRAAFETRPARAAAVIALPDMHTVCDRVQQMGH